MKKFIIALALLACVFMVPQTGFADSFWFGFGVNSGYGYGGGYYGGSCGYVPVAPVVPYYGGGCSTTIINGPVYGYHPYRPYNHRYYRNWFDGPYCAPARRRVYYGGAYHPAPPVPHYSWRHHRPRHRPRVHINNCNNCTLYGKGYRRRP